MSVKSIRKPVTSFLDSNISLISHQSESIDSLDYSDEGFVFDEDIMLSDAKMTDSIEEKPKRHLDSSGKLDCKKDSSGEHVYDKENTVKDTESEVKKVNSDKLTNEKKPEKSDSIREKLCLNLPKSKIPKSKTFDTASSVFNKRSDSYRFQGSREGNGNHVFLTSQECMVVPGCSRLPRETIASRLRFEKQHTHEGISPTGNSCPGIGEGYHKGCVPDGYKTPSQRKDILIRDLRRQVREMKTVCEEKDREIAMYKQHVDEETSKLVQAKDEEITRLREELKQVKQNYDDISNFCEESITTASALEQKASDLKSAMDDREREHQRLYLEMYRKGQDSARFEREEELERLAGAGGCKVTISELVRKLAWTELELAKWQTIKRHESYHEALRPETEAETILRFLKDSFFHYITDEKDADHHLRAMVKIFKYTEPQMKKIKESRLIEMIEKKYKRKSKRH